MGKDNGKVIPQEDPQIFEGVRSFLKALNESGDPPLETLSVEDARKVLEGAQKSVSFQYKDIEESERTIESDGHSIKLMIVKPTKVAENAPVFMFFHGGGWVLGDYPTHKRLVRDLVVHSGAVAVFPEYSRSPEARYPVAIEEAYTATVWVAKHGKEIGVDGSRLAVVGNSAGGNMATVVSILSKERKGPKIKFQALLWPVTDFNVNTESYQLFAEGRFLTKPMMKWFGDHYIPDESKRTEIYASPLQATLEQLKGLPPALVQTAEHDVLRDEGEAYARKLDEAGVEVTLTRYMGTIHDFGMLNPLSKEAPGIHASLQVAGLLQYYLR
jgi:acetyl esterase/lipase